jgi:hypothetical protein
MRAFKSSVRRVRMATFLSLGTFAGTSAACRKDAEARGGVSRNWTPPAQEMVMDVPVDSVKSAIAKRLAAPPPQPVTADQWRHTKKLYANFGQNLLWLSEG